MVSELSLLYRGPELNRKGFRPRQRALSRWIRPLDAHKAPARGLTLLPRGLGSLTAGFIECVGSSRCHEFNMNGQRTAQRLGLQSNLDLA